MYSLIEGTYRHDPTGQKILPAEAKLRHPPKRCILVVRVVPVPISFGCCKWDLVGQLK